MNNISLFDFIHDLDPEDIKKETVAADLSMLLVHSNCSRSQLAEDLGYKKSRVSRILSGDENLTLKTLTKVADSLGYTFDVIFYNKSYPKPKQPWEIDREKRKVDDVLYKTFGNVQQASSYRDIKNIESHKASANTLLNEIESEVLVNINSVESLGLKKHHRRTYDLI